MKDQRIKNRSTTMKRLIPSVAVALLCACGAPPTAVEEMCQRADECNYLGGSVEECIEDRERCVDGLTESQRRDWERMIDSCLANQSCPLAFDCYEVVPWC